MGSIVGVTQGTGMFVSRLELMDLHCAMQEQIGALNLRIDALVAGTGTFTGLERFKVLPTDTIVTVNVGVNTVINLITQHAIVAFPIDIDNIIVAVNGIIEDKDNYIFDLTVGAETFTLMYDMMSYDVITFIYIKPF